ncbi:MAG: RNase adapter RapZ [Deltaproteobacteria bacterium]|nr:MAG: RNase adapter RapZ [Deltaproteobacteria bacterium]
MRDLQLIIISGLSGSGKSTALAALEDSGYYCVDNLPASLIPTLVELCRHSSRGISRVAMVVDIRGREFLEGLQRTIESLRSKGHEVRVIFLEASDETLIARYNQTRRRHPLEKEKGVPLSEAVKVEREEMAFLREMADEVIETTTLSARDLRSLMMERLGPLAREVRMEFVSFGFNYGLPSEADIVMDVRFLPNPFYVKELRELEGLHEAVRRYVLEKEESKGFIKLFTDLLDYLLPLYEKEGKFYLTVAFGCTGGRHRSVVIAEELADLMRKSGREVSVRHRDL